MPAKRQRGSRNVQVYFQDEEFLKVEQYMETLRLQNGIELTFQQTIRGLTMRALEMIEDA